MRARSEALAASFARFSSSLALRVSCCAKPATVRFCRMVTLSPRAAPSSAAASTSSHRWRARASRPQCRRRGQG
eukprot:52999-Pleurochrysis_carterae.AAC.1